MGFCKKLKYFLVHTAMYTNKAAQALIDNGEVTINGQTIKTNCTLDELGEIKIKNKVVRGDRSFVYLKFYKPVGYQSSLNKSVENNLAPFFMTHSNLAIAGRLDKQSEGLMLLSNDGKWVEQICNPTFEKEKEYRVTLNKNVTNDFVKSFGSGVQIGDYFTKPCYCEMLFPRQLKIILKEGKNRQIRKMCKILGNEVLTLKRLRIANIELDNLITGEVATIKKF